MTLARTPRFVPLAAIQHIPEPTGARTRTEIGAAVRDYLVQVREEIRVLHDQGTGGCEVVAVYTDAVDRLMRFLYAEAALQFVSRYARINQRCTVIGQGGYGRGELNPGSDIDLLFLYPWKSSPYVETIAEVILYTLWDAGLTVGHALRNVRECSRLAARDMKVKTALLDARYLAGDETLYHEFDAAMLEEVWAYNPTAFFKEKLAENTDRHARAGNSVYLLQPQLKEGQGGLRDLHTALWMAKVKFKVRTFRELVTLGVVSEREIKELETALDFAWRIRNAMHLSTGTHQDTLTFELQQQLAPAFGFAGGKPGVETFMCTYFGHAATILRFNETVIGHCVQTEPYRGVAATSRPIRAGMRIQGRTLTVTGPEVFAREPAAVVRVFAEAQRHGVALSRPTQELIRSATPLLERAHDSPKVAQSFLSILRAKGHVFETLAEMHKLGALRAVIPEFGHLDCLVSHDPFHIYTVDHHSLVGVQELERLREGEFDRTLPHLTQVMNEVPQPELLFLGMMLHDVGKGHGHDHSGRGAAMTRDITRRLQLNVDEGAAVELLVQHHLLMSHLAQRRDVNDDQLIAEFCRTLGSLENLQRLYLLTYADMRAVGPGVWTTWRDTLVTELYARSRELFEKGAFEPEDRPARAMRIRNRIAAQGSTDALAKFLASMPDSYVLSTPEEMIPVHGDLALRFAAREEAGERPAWATAISHFPERDYTEFAVCTRDRPGLFAMLSGVLAAGGFNIVAARINTSNAGLALDAFRVSHEGNDVLDPERWERLERTLGRVLTAEIDVEQLVRQSQRPSLLLRRRRAVAPRVEIDNQVSQQYTVLDVYAADRVGLLFTITNCLYHLWLEIHLAKITTMVDQVLDVFYVTDHEGRKITDVQRLQSIQSELIGALEEPPAAEQSATQAVGG